MIIFWGGFELFLVVCMNYFVCLLFATQLASNCHPGDRQSIWIELWTEWNAQVHKQNIWNKQTRSTLSGLHFSFLFAKTGKISSYN